MMVERTCYEDCCGINIISNFPHEDDYDWEDSISPDDVECHLREVDEFLLSMRVGLYLVALSSFQYSKLGKGLKSRGFKTLKQFRNPNTGNQIRLYSYEKKSQRRPVIRRPI